MATPAHADFTGTPVSMSAREAPHTDAIDEMLKNKEAELLEV